MEAEARDLFVAIDADGSGSIDRGELKTIMGSIIGSATPDLDAIVGPSTFLLPCASGRS